MDINDVDEIHVKFPESSGMKDVIYRGKGLEKFRRLIISSPAYGDSTPHVIDSFSEDEEDTGKKKKTKPKKGKDRKEQATANGYVQTSLDYSGSQATKGKSAIDLAREMQKQAENAAGFKF
jgi:hypothetical protein